MRTLRKCLSMVLAILLLMGCMSVATVFVGAAEITENGVTYEAYTDTKTARVTSYTNQGTADEVTILSEVEGCKVTTIGQSAFRFNSNIVSVTLPETVAYIEGYVFDECRNLEVVDVKGNLKSIGSAAFRGCTKLSEINLGNRLQSVGAAAFKNTGLKAIDIPDTCLSFGTTVFYGCKNLERATLPSAITEINENMFSGCSSLKEIVIPDEVISIKKEAFYDCSSLESVTMGSKVKTIGVSAFQNCTSLKSVEFPDTLTYISMYAFWDCDSLEKLTIPGAVKNIEYQAFRGCDKLKSVSISEGVSEIKERAFMNCGSLREIVIPASVSGISTTALYMCKNVTLYGVKDSAAHKYAKDNKFAFIGYEIDEKGDATITAYECPGKTEVTIPETILGADVRTIGTDAFRNNKEIKSITLLSNVTKVSDYAFEGCKNLEKVQLYADSTHIGKFAFANCPSIKNVSLPDEIATVDECAFGYVTTDEGYAVAENFCIYGSINSTAYEYCKANGVDFRFGLLKEVATGEIVMGMNCKENSYKEGDKYILVNILGDVNADNVVNIKDATQIQKVCASLAAFDEATEHLADTTLDGRYNVKDATQIQKYVASLIDSFYK